MNHGYCCYERLGIKLNISKILYWIAGILLVSEVLVELLGFVDVPIYQANNQIGYIPAPNQAGAFMRSHTWRFNEYSMGAGPFKPNSKRFNLLLIGDSLVLGGNPLSEPERLGPQLEKLTGWQVWPISAGSWAMQNELTYMRQHPSILDKMDAIVILSNSGDFDVPSSWASDLTHPLQHPFPSIIYLVRKYLIHPSIPPHASPEMQVLLRDWQYDLHEISYQFKKPIYVFMYPNLAEFHDGVKRQNQLDSKIPLVQVPLGKTAKIYKIMDDSNWNETLYRDDIHPSGAGNSVLVRMMQRDICNSSVDKMHCRVDAE
jgi:hypothetical protein